MNSTKIYVAAHKKIELDLPGHCRLIQVNAGKNGHWDGYLHDDDNRDNISDKNNSYCELTALYSLWKDNKLEIGGLFHYRRFLSALKEISLSNEQRRIVDKKRIGQNIIPKEDVIRLLDSSDVILPLPDAPFPLIAYEDLQKFVFLDDIWKMIDCIKVNYPDYEEDLWAVLLSTNICYCNMFIARRDFINEYCGWLFTVLGLIEPDIPVEDYDINHQRIFGYYAEVLLNVFVRHKRKKAEYVYRVDLFEGEKQDLNKYKLKSNLNKLIIRANIYPLGYPRKINQARYRVLNGTQDPSVNFEGLDYKSVQKQASEYLINTGAQDLRTAEEENYCMISGTYYGSRLYFCFCKTQAGLEEAARKSEEIRRQPQTFGQVNAIRLYSIGPVDNNLENELLRSGITVFKI